jgi:Fe-S cluster assembly ATPase SufC
MRLEIRKGTLRGLKDLKLQFGYPITAISGRNGTGKSTLLGCAACAYHNIATGFKLLSRHLPYYTFSDFFVQSSEESAPSGITIAYQLLFDKWTKSPRVPTGIGLGWQYRQKAGLGRWNNYDTMHV